MAAPMINDVVLQMLEKNPSLQLTEDQKKVKCSLSGHEMPCTLEALKSYTQGKKYKKLLAANQYSYDEYKEFIIPSNKKHHLNQLFCKLTLRHLNKQPSHIEKHIQGRRFQRAFKRWQECQKTGETFKPYTGPRQKQRDDEPGRRKAREEDAEWDETGSGGDESDADSLSDLYPAADFQTDEENEEESDSDFEFENMETSENEKDIQQEEDTQHTNTKVKSSKVNKKRSKGLPSQNGNKKAKRS